MAMIGPLLEMRSVSKTFPGARALHQVDFHLNEGEVLALVGENGAGKSTLLKILAGAQQPTSGQILLGGKPITLTSPHFAHSKGIAVIYQELNLIPGLSASANVFLGQERSFLGFLRAGEERRRAKELFERLGASIHPDTPCRQLTVAQQQIVEIAKALAVEARIVVMDEPSASLTVREVDRLLQIVKDLRDQGIAILYVTHRMSEIFEIADRAQVLRDGESVGERDIKDLTRHELIRMMNGQKLKEE